MNEREKIVSAIESMTSSGSVSEKQQGKSNQETMVEPQAEMIDPIEVLMKEHEEGLEQLGCIAQAAKSIQVEGFTAKAFLQIAEAVRLMDALMRKHNPKEELCLFPLIERHVNGTPNTMRIEHWEINRVFNELVNSVRDVEDGRIHGSSIRELVQAANSVVDQMTSHISKENTVLYPMAKRLLTQAEYEQLKSDIAAAERGNGT